MFSHPVWSLCAGTPLPVEAVRWGGGGSPGSRIALSATGRCVGRAAGCSPASELRLLRSKITARELGLRLAPSPLPPPAFPPASARAATQGTLRGSQDPQLGLGLWASPTCLACEAEDEKKVMLGKVHHRLVAVSPFLLLPSLSFLSF